MAYTALYRKWRPQTFDEVKGQDAIVQTLRHQVQTGQTGHAYLFCGTRGTGKTTLAKILARAVNCEHPVNGSPCNECASCRAILAGAAMNVVEIDAASNNGVDNVREIVEEVQYPPADGRFRVYIIDEAHMLSPGAFNALLKTLEEPPSYVIFVLATTEVHKILPTVLSRCQRYDFKRIPLETIRARLDEMLRAEGVEAEEEALRYIARRGDGSMRDAISLLEQCTAFYDRQKLTYDGVLSVLGEVDYEVYHRLFDAAMRGDTAACIRLLDGVLSEGRELSRFAADFTWYLRDLLILKTTGTAGEELIDMTSEDRARLGAMAQQADEQTLVRCIRIFAELLNRMRYAPDQRVLTEAALIRLSRPQMETDIASLTERVRQLEARLAEGNFTAAAPAAQPQPERPVVVKKVPKLQLQDLNELKEQWRRIVGALSSFSYQAGLKGVELEPIEEGVVGLVFPDALKCYYGGRPQVLQDLAAATADIAGRQVEYRARAREKDEPQTRYVVSEQELQSVFHMELTQETDGAGAEDEETE